MTAKIKHYRYHYLINSQTFQWFLYNWNHSQNRPKIVFILAEWYTPALAHFRVLGAFSNLWASKSGFLNKISQQHGFLFILTDNPREKWKEQILPIPTGVLCCNNFSENTPEDERDPVVSYCEHGKRVLRHMFLRNCYEVGTKSLRKSLRNRTKSKSGVEPLTNKPNVWGVISQRRANNILTFGFRML